MASLQVAMFSGILMRKSGGIAGEGCQRSVRWSWRVPTSVSVSRGRGRSFGVSCEVRDGDAHGEEPPESLFMKELKRRGMTPASLLEDSKRGKEGPAEGLEEDKGSRRSVVSTKADSGLSNQRQRSMALNNEGLEGLIPRVKLFLSIGGTFFLGFGPLILIIVAFFSALYLFSTLESFEGGVLVRTLVYLGSSFVHNANDMQVSPPQYIDPYSLLEGERISQIASSVN